MEVIHAKSISVDHDHSSYKYLYFFNVAHVYISLLRGQTEIGTMPINIAGHQHRNVAKKRDPYFELHDL